MEYKQLSIFDMVDDPEAGFCFDNDINYIESELTRIAELYGYRNEKSDFKVWSHCPQHGYRLTHRIMVHKGNPYEKDFLHDLDVLVAEAKKRGVELSPMWSGAFFFSGAKEARLYCYTLFLDSRRAIK